MSETPFEAVPRACFERSLAGTSYAPSFAHFGPELVNGPQGSNCLHSIENNSWVEFVDLCPAGRKSSRPIICFLKSNNEVIVTHLLANFESQIY